MACLIILLYSVQVQVFSAFILLVNVAVTPLNVIVLRANPIVRVNKIKFHSEYKHVYCAVCVCDMLLWQVKCYELNFKLPLFQLASFCIGWFYHGCKLVILILKSHKIGILVQLVDENSSIFKFGKNWTPLKCIKF